jgi:hypothetical protein
VQCQTVTLIDHNHMSAVRDLGDPQSHAGELLRGMIGSRSF